MISDLDMKRDGLRQDLSKAQNELRDAKAKLAQQDKDLADCNSDTQAAKASLTNWPKVWADSTEWNPPPPPPAPEKKKGKHRK